MKIVDLAQRTQQWHDWRAKGVSASDAATLLGVSPYKTLWRLWAEKTGYALPEDLSNNPNVLRGVEFEPEARTAYEDKHSELLLPVCAESSKHPIIRASLDGLDSKGRPVELKCPSLSTWDEVTLRGMESVACKIYELQVQYQLIVTGADEGFLVFYNVDTKRLIEFTIKADPKVQKQLIEAATEFWDAVQNRKEPPKDPERDLFIPTGAQAQEWIGAAEHYRLYAGEIADLKARIKELEELQKPHAEQIINLMGDYCFGEFCGVSVTRYQAKGRVDYKRAIEELGNLTEDDLEAYRTESAGRTRFTVVDSLVPRNIADESVVESLEDTTGILESQWF